LPASLRFNRPRFRAGANRFAREALLASGWQETAGDDWDLFWDPEQPTIAKCRRVAEGQIYGHFRGVGALSIKTRLYQNLTTARVLLGAAGDQEYDFTPLTFFMPDERAALLAAAADSPETLWIQKPRALAGGRGVTLLADASQATTWDGWLVQEYLSSPHLLDGYKYTLRCYLLISSLDPLEVGLYRDGFCKRASRPFRLDGEARTDRFRHLTNPEVLREDRETPTSSRNLTHTAYRRRLREDGLDDEMLWRRIRRMLALTAIAAREDMLAQARNEGIPPRAGFELVGVDVLVDSTLRPWLLECNLLPSLTVEAAPSTEPARQEQAIKRQVVRDTLAQLGVEVLPLDEAPPPDCTFGFERLLPDRSLLPLFPFPRAADLAGGPAPPIRLCPDDVVGAPVGDQLLLCDRMTGAVTLLGAAQAALWRRVEAGCEEPTPGERAILAEWLHAGLLRRADSRVFAVPERGQGPAAWLDGACVSRNGNVAMRVGGARQVSLPGDALQAVAFPQVGGSGQRDLTAAEGVRRIVASGLHAAPGIDQIAAHALAHWLATRRYLLVGVPDPRAPKPPSKRDWIAACLEQLSSAFRQHDIWHSLAYGTLLGALREQDVIAWDYDFDLLVRPEEVARILALAPLLARDGFRLEPTRKPPNFLAMNLRGIESFSTAAIGVYHRERKVGDLYSFSLFSDGVMRRWDFEHEVYWCPHSSFPAWFTEELTEVTLRGKSYPSLRAPEKWIAGVYGEDWRTPYKAVAQGGQSRTGATIHGDLYEPKLAAEIAWCVERGWDPGRYSNAHAWPRPIGGAGPKGPTARTADNSRALWWRDLDELARHF
jgi:hypothetical protein